MATATQSERFMLLSTGPMSSGISGFKYILAVIADLPECAVFAANIAIKRLLLPISIYG
jgi:hypothetical protein